MTGLSKWIIAVWCVAFAVLILDTGVSIFNIEALVANDKAVNHSRDIGRTLVELLSSLKDAETGQRGYLLTNQEEYLEPFQTGVKDIPLHLDRLHELTANDEFYLDRIPSLQRHITERMDSLSRIIGSHRDRGQAAARTEMREGVGKNLMDIIRAEIHDMENHEGAILSDRSGEAKSRYRSSRFSALVGGVLTVVMVAMAFILVRLESARRKEAESRSQQAALELAEEQSKQSQILATLVKLRTAELEAANELLREEISVRILAEQRVQAAHTELARSNGELEKFAYVASHDLQEPLRKIQAFGDRLVKKHQAALGPEGKEYLERMQMSATRMRKLIDDLLTYSRVTLKPNPFVTVDLGEVLREVEENLSSRIEESEGQIEYFGLPKVLGDASQLKQVFQNLIANSLKFQKPGIAPSVSVRAMSWAQLPADADPPPRSDAGVRLCIADNGIGFDQAYSERIFEVFQRLHGRGEYEGTGIGLAICKKIVERHGGSIVARSREGEGSTFVIDLPESPPPLAPNEGYGADENVRPSGCPDLSTMIDYSR